LRRCVKKKKKKKKNVGGQVVVLVLAVEGEEACEGFCLKDRQVSAMSEPMQSEGTTGNAHGSKVPCSY